MNHFLILGHTAIDIDEVVAITPHGVTGISISLRRKGLWQWLSGSHRMAVVNFNSLETRGKILSAAIRQMELAHLQSTPTHHTIRHEVTIADTRRPTP